MEIVDENAALKSVRDADTYYFCGEDCRTKFDDDPSRYAAPNPAA
jgi:YHS domain-containing protein